MTLELKNAYSTYIEKSAQIKKLSAELEKAKKIIKEYHSKTGLKTINEDGFTSTLTSANRSSLDAALLEKKFGIAIPKKNEDGWLECYSLTSYDTLRVAVAAPEAVPEVAWQIEC